MTHSQFNPRLDLVLERIVDVPRDLVWMAWTTPQHLKPWFCPLPWKTVECEIDLRPGGIFRTVMRSPEGQDHPNTGCYLEIVKNERLVWTDALLSGYRPAEESRLGFHFTGVITLETHGQGTKYTALAMHSTEAASTKHKEMGFHEGWGVCADQLAAYVKTLKK